MDDLREYVAEHTVRGECNCGRCVDRSDAPDPTGHTVDMVFFKVAVKGSPDTEEFKRLSKSLTGDFTDCDPFDGHEHNFMELGGWIGDQGLAMQYMALGVLLGIFKLLSPKTMLGMDGELAVGLASNGLLAVMAT